MGVGLFGQFGAAALHDDRIYFDYASRALAGAVPYRDYAVEYPPLALPLFVVPRLIASRFETYPFMFALEMLVFDGLAVYLVVRHVAARAGPRGVPARLAWYTAGFAALYPFVGSRYDMAPAAVAGAAALAWFGGRPVAGGLLAAAGTLLKAFPAAVAAVAASDPAAPSAVRSRGVVAFAAMTLAGGAVWLVLGGTASLAYHVERGLQIETVWAGALMLADRVAGVAPASRYSHTSVELAAPGAGLLAALAIPAQLVLLGVVLWRFRRSDPREPLRYAAAAILAVIVAGKVLSPQYLVWLLPLVPAIDGPAGWAARRLFVVVCAATTLEYLVSRQIAAFETWAILILNGRNALLVALFLVLLRQGTARPRF